MDGPPPGTQELAIVVEDPDAPGPEPFCHWLVWGLAPQAGKLLLFLSARFEHEVLPARRDRMSIACWMRQRSLAATNP